MEKIEINQKVVDQVVTPHWAYCFNSNCELAGKCFRLASSRFIPEKTLCGRAVYPGACRDGKCRYYVELELMRMAWGFGKLYWEAKSCDVAPLRKRMQDMFGGKTGYYKYHRGDKKLTPEQQADIARLFAQYGYDKVTFDFYAEIPGLRKGDAGKCDEIL